MFQTDHDLVSVVIPTRNRRDYLEMAIKSAKTQTWPNLEIVVVDDASSDGTQAFLRQLVSTDDGVHTIRNEVAQGGGGARNQGVAAAKGPYIAFLDDDDIWLPEKLEEQIALMRANPGASAVSCGFIVQHSSFIHQQVNVVPPEDEQQILRSNHLGGASMCLTTKKSFASVGGFDPSLRSGQDWDLWIKLQRSSEVLVCDKPLVRYMPHEGVRITSNPHSTYVGRRRIFFQYRSRMTAETRKYHLCELLYCRKVLLEHHRARQMIGLLKLVGLAGLMQGLRYFYRYLKLRFADYQSTIKRIP